MAIKKSSVPERRAESPEKLFPLLRRTGHNSNTLWPQQVDLLREYATKRVNARDLAIELPTGTGKTLTGLLLADWRRREGKGRTVFVCPTVQLIRQVVAAAEREGIPVVDLSGPSKKWDSASRLAYERERATAVVAYSAIFNIAPKLTAADLLVFDDAHAGEQYVSKAYTVSLPRTLHSSIYADVLDAIAPKLSKERHHQLAQNNPGAGTRELVDAISLAQADTLLPALSRALERFSTVEATDKSTRDSARDAQFAYAAIAGHLAACTMYISWSKIEIRPATPPTFENALFASATQRIYLSATLGTSGELERAFGRPVIRRLARPGDAPAPTSGRRFLVFPHLVPDVNPDEFTKELIERIGKSIIITPSTPAADAAEERLVPDGWDIYDKDDVEDSLGQFADAANAVAVLANRYDGIDLPGDACRSVTIFGYPGVTNLQERFLASRARAAIVSAERVRSRLVQGIGRCTRGPRDFALVIISDQETTTYFSRTEVTDTLSEDLQSEITFGIEQSEQSADGVRENVDMFLAQGDEWFDDAEDELTRLRQSATQVVPTAAEALASAAKYEVEAQEAAWNGDWITAAKQLNLAAMELGQPQDVRGYRAVLLFRAAVAMDKAARDTGVEGRGNAADGLAQQALEAAKPATWMSTLLPFEGRTALEPSPQLISAARRLSVYVGKAGSAQKMRATFQTMFDGLSQIDHKQYEPALTELGKFLGADAFKPSGDSRTDSAWCWDDHQWITLEAKSEHRTDGPIGTRDTQQVNGHLKLVAEDRESPIPPTSAAVMISPRTIVKRDAIVIADDTSWRVTPADILTLANQTERLWEGLRLLKHIASASDREQNVISLLREHHLRPEDIMDFLTTTRIGEV